MLHNNWIRLSRRLPSHTCKRENIYVNFVHIPCWNHKNIMKEHLQSDSIRFRSMPKHKLPKCIALSSRLSMHHVSLCSNEQIANACDFCLFEQFLKDMSLSYITLFSNQFSRTSKIFQSLSTYHSCVVRMYITSVLRIYVVDKYGWENCDITDVSYYDHAKIFW